MVECDAGQERCIPDLVWDPSDGESMPDAAGIVWRLLERRRASTWLGLIAGSVEGMVCEGRHKGEERVERSEE